MSKGNKETKISQLVRGLCKIRTEEELIEEEETFNEYLIVVEEIYKRIEQKDKKFNFDARKLE